MEKLIGSIETGKQADIILVDMNQPHLTPLYIAILNLSTPRAVQT